MGSKVFEFTDKDGHFRRKPSVFRSWISSEPGARFAPSKDRYVLYINWGCPWAHRANLVRSLKGLEDVIELVVMSFELTDVGWLFTGEDGTMAVDPLYGLKNTRELYLKADPEYNGRYTVPILWDKREETIVNNESSEIIRMFYNAFDELLPAELREVNKPNGGLLPPTLKEDIEAMNEWVYDTVNNGVYKTGMATSQEAYDLNIIPLFASLDRLEKHLQESREGPYLFGKDITEADIRLYTTLIRFDVAYYTLFRCNLRMIRYGYPALHKWLQTLYWNDSEQTRGAFKKTTYFDHIKGGYAKAVAKGNNTKVIVPKGPVPDILPHSK